jgi:hypothetical protein
MPVQHPPGPFDSVCDRPTCVEARSDAADLAALVLRVAEVTHYACPDGPTVLGVGPSQIRGRESAPRAQSHREGSRRFRP